MVDVHDSDDPNFTGEERCASSAASMEADDSQAATDSPATTDSPVTLSQVGTQESPVDGTDLDSSLWANLPEVLVEYVLRFLPAESVFRFHSVCKRWHGILTDRDFLVGRLGPPHHSPFCVISDAPNKRFAVYNIGSDLWYFPPYDALVSLQSPSSRPVSIQRTTLRAAAVGLILLEPIPAPHWGRRDWESRSDIAVADDGVEEGQTLFLVNPANKSHRRLPLIPDSDPDDGEYLRRPKVVGMAYNPETQSHQILARTTLLDIGETGDARLGRSQFHVYDLKADSWEMIYDSRFTGGPEEWDKSYRVLEPAVLHGGFWYYLAYAHSFWARRARDAAPCVFRVKRGVAEAVKAPLPQEAGLILEFLHLFVCQEKLILAGSVKIVDHLILNEWLSFCFWKLDLEKSEWVEYLRMPGDLVNYLADRGMKRFALDLECSVDGDHICFWVGRPSGKHHRTIEIIMYSISRDAWWIVSSPVDMPQMRRERAVDMLRIRIGRQGVYGFGDVKGGFAAPYGYFLFRPNLNIIL